MGRTSTDRDISEKYGNIGKNITYFVPVEIMHHLERIAKDNKCSFRNAITLCIDKYLFYEEQMQQIEKLPENSRFENLEKMIEQIKMGKLLDKVEDLPYSTKKYLYYLGKHVEYDLGIDKNNIIEKFVNKEK